MNYISTVSQAEAGSYSEGVFFIKETGLTYYYESSSTLVRNGLTILNTAQGGNTRLLAIGNNLLSVPVGTILSIARGYFGATANGGGWTNIDTNTVAGLNSYLSANGFSNYKVCDGTAPNDSGSPYYNSASRYLPDLTDSRFFRGSTTAGGVANSSGTATSGGGSAHSHTTPNHTHGAGSYVAGIHFDATNDRVYMNRSGDDTNATGYYPHTGISAFVTGSTTENFSVNVQGTSASDGASNTGSESSHTHTITVSAVEPKYFAGYYIMRIK